MGAAAWGDMNRSPNRYYARLKEVLDRLEVDRAILVGNALGATIDHFLPQVDSPPEAIRLLR